MNRRQMIIGTGAAAAIAPLALAVKEPGMAVAPPCPEVDELDKPWAKSFHDSIGEQIYVEYAPAGMGKTTRLVETALRRGAVDGTMAAIFSSEVCPGEFLDIRQRIITDQRRPQAERDFLSRCQPEQFLVFSGADCHDLVRQFWAHWKSDIRPRTPRPRIRFYFDNWGQFSDMPSEPVAGGYYTAAAAYPIHDSFFIPRIHPEFQDALHAAAGFNLNIYWKSPLAAESIKVDLEITK